jgi:hypothetical protein
MKLIVLASLLTASHAYADNFCKSHTALKSGSVDEIERAKLVDEALCKSSRLEPYYFDGVELTEVERFAHVTACLAHEPNGGGNRVAEFVAFCADDLAHFDDATAKAMLKKLGVGGYAIETVWNKHAPEWRTKLTELKTDAKWKPLLAAYHQGADAWGAAETKHHDDIVKARELQQSAERDPSAAKGCTATAAKLMQAYLGAAKPKTLEAVRGALADPLGFQIYSAFLACTAADQLGPAAWVLTEQPPAAGGMKTADYFEVEPVRGPRIAGALAANAELVKSKPSKEELKELSFFSKASLPKREDRLGAVGVANGGSIAGFKAETGTIAAIKPEQDGRVLVTFKTESVKYDTETCHPTKQIARIGLDGTIEYGQWCEVTGSETVKVTPHAVIIPKELAGGLKPGRVVSYFWKGGSFSKGPDQGAIHTIWKDAKKKEIVGWAGTSW